MYLVALIQNQSEMMRYSYADIRPLLNLKNYRFDLYTAENVLRLADALNRGSYDAIVIGSNALNDPEIREGLFKQREDISRYLEKPRGLVVLHQMRMTTVSSYGFLPEQFDVSAIDRKKDDPKERAIEGELSIDPANKDHVILLYPNPVSINPLRERSLAAHGIEGLYWHYLKPLDYSVWVRVIVDFSFAQTRDLLLVSRADLFPRIVISSLTLDWHRQSEIFENILRYVTEGRPNSAIITTKGRGSFPFEYLLASLKIRKFPHSVYSQQAIRFNDIPLNVHRTIVLDPNWSSKDIQDSDFQNFEEYLDKGSKLIHFDKAYQGKFSMVCVGGESEYERVKKNAMVWIVSKFAKGLWDGSFWGTADVLQVLTEFDEPLDQYKKEVLEYVALHDIDGSYDEVFGASCALLWIYYLFLGSKDRKFKNTLEWIRSKISECGLYEKALAYDTLLELGFSEDKTTINSFRDQVMKEVQTLPDELKSLRYAKTLLSYGLVQETEEIAKKLKPLQHPSGKWIDVSTTSVIIRLLIRLRKEMSKPMQEIDEMIFNGMMYIREQLNSQNFWGNRVSETAKALAAWRDFDSLISGFPVEEVVNSIQRTDSLQSNTIAIDSAMNLIRLLRGEIAETKRSLGIKNRMEKTLRKISLLGVLISLFSIISTLFLLSYVVSEGLLYDAAATMQEWVGVKGTLLTFIVAIIVLTLYLLSRYGLLPDKIRWIMKAIARAFRIPFPEE